MVEYRKPYATADGFVCVLPYTTAQWRAFFALMERPDLAEDERVTDARLRSEKIGELYELVAQCVRDWPTDKLLAALEEADIPSGRATPLGELAEEPQLKAVGLFQHFEHPSEGDIRLAGPGVRFSKTPAEIRTLPARLGEHSVEILQQAGYSESEIETMLADGVTTGK